MDLGEVVENANCILFNHPVSASRYCHKVVLLAETPLLKQGGET
jgi:hypothetical protein